MYACMQISARGLQYGKLRTAIVLCVVDAGGCHARMANSSHGPWRRPPLRDEAQSVPGAPFSELPLYILDEHATVLYPLALQEHIVCKVNSVIDSFNGNLGSVPRMRGVENDLWVDSEGWAVGCGAGHVVRR